MRVCRGASLWPTFHSSKTSSISCTVFYCTKQIATVHINQSIPRSMHHKKLTWEDIFLVGLTGKIVWEFLCHITLSKKMGICKNWKLIFSYLFLPVCPSFRAATSWDLLLLNGQESYETVLRNASKGLQKKETRRAHLLRINPHYTGPCPISAAMFSFTQDMHSHIKCAPRHSLLSCKLEKEKTISLRKIVILL